LIGIPAGQRGAVGAKKTRRLEGARIDLLVQPKASRSEVVGFEQGLLKMRVCSAPTGGAANKECLSLLSRTLGVAKTRIRLIRGMAGRRKVVVVEEMTLEAIEERVREATAT